MQADQEASESKDLKARKEGKVEWIDEENTHRQDQTIDKKDEKTKNSHFQNCSCWRNEL